MSSHSSSCHFRAAPAGSPPATQVDTAQLQQACLESSAMVLRMQAADCQAELSQVGWRSHPLPPG